MSALQQCMRELLSAQEFLLGWLIAEEEALRNRNYRELGHIANQKMKCLQQVQILVDARDRALKALLPDENLATFEKLEAIAGMEAWAEIQTLRDRSREIGEQSSQLNSVNTSTMRLMSQFVGGMLAALTPQATTVRTYGKAGLNDVRIGTSRLLSSA